MSRESGLFYHVWVLYTLFGQACLMATVEIVAGQCMYDRQSANQTPNESMEFMHQRGLSLLAVVFHSSYFTVPVLPASNTFCHTGGGGEIPSRRRRGQYGS